MVAIKFDEFYAAYTSAGKSSEGQPAGPLRRIGVMIGGISKLMFAVLCRLESAAVGGATPE
jgi:hypothetical protein